MNTFGCKEIILPIQTIHVILNTITQTRTLKGGGFGLIGRSRVVYCGVTEANLGIMSCRHNTYPLRHYAGCCLYPDGLEFYQIMCVITLPHFGHVGCMMSTCD